jgi:hypothetical protein
MKSLLKTAAAVALFSIAAPAAAQELHAVDHSALMNQVTALNARTEIGITRAVLGVTEERIAALIAAHDFRTASPFYFAAELPSLKRPRILLAP